MKGKVTPSKPPLVPWPANAISRTTTRPESALGFGSLRGVANAMEGESIFGVVRLSDMMARSRTGRGRCDGSSRQEIACCDST